MAKQKKKGLQYVLWHPKIDKDTCNPPANHNYKVKYAAQEFATRACQDDADVDIGGTCTIVFYSTNKIERTSAKGAMYQTRGTLKVFKRVMKKNKDNKWCKVGKQSWTASVDQIPSLIASISKNDIDRLQEPKDLKPAVAKFEQQEQEGQKKEKAEKKTKAKKKKKKKKKEQKT